MGKVNKWAISEIAFIEKWYPIYGSKYCSKELKTRNVRSVYLKAKKMGLKTLNKKSIKYKYTEFNFREIIKQSSHINDVITRLNLKLTSSNIKTVRHYVNKYKIDISHFNSRVSFNFPCKLTSDQLLVENCIHGRASLRKLIVSNNLLPYECRECKLSNKWNNKNLVLQLDHINGINNDNRIENLRFLCPNCHSQTTTYSGKNCNNINKKDNLKLQRDLNKGFTDKELAAQLKQRKVVRPSLQILLDNLNKMGYTSTGKLYGVSDNTIRKWIKYYEKVQ